MEESEEESGPQEEIAFRRMLLRRVQAGHMTQREFEGIVGTLQRSDARKEARRPRITVEQLQTALEDHRRRRIPLKQWLKSVGPAVYVMTQSGRGKGNVDKWLVSQLEKAGVSEADLPQPEEEEEALAPQKRGPIDEATYQRRLAALTKARDARSAKRREREAQPAGRR